MYSPNKRFNLGQLVGHIGDDNVLIRVSLGSPLVNLYTLSQARLEVLLGFALHIDGGSVVVSTVLTGDPTKFVDVAREVEPASGIQTIV